MMLENSALFLMSEDLSNRKFFNAKSNYSSLTESFLRPLALLLASTVRPFLVAILARKPCLFTLFLLLGWKVGCILGFSFDK